MNAARTNLPSLCFAVAVASGLAPPGARADEPSTLRRLDRKTAEEARNVRVVYEFGPFLTPGDCVDLVLCPRKPQNGEEVEARIVLEAKTVHSVGRFGALSTITVPLTAHEAAMFSQAAREARLRPIMRTPIDRYPVLLMPSRKAALNRPTADE